MNDAALVDTKKTPWALALAFLALPLVGLLWLKWPAALATLEKVQASGLFVPKADVFPSDGLPWWQKPLARTASYLFTVRWALFWGLCISAAVRAFALPKAATAFLQAEGVRGSVAGGLIGAPLMLCSCCVAPVASSVAQKSGRLAPALGLLLAAPSLNPAALALTFLLFPATVAWARVAMALTVVVLGAALAAQWTPGQRANRSAVSAAEPPADALAAAASYARAWLRVAAQTLPLVALGVLLSTLLLDGAVDSAAWLQAHRAWAVLLVAAVAVPIALPTFFEIPLALLLMSQGAPAGAVAVLLFAGPAINLPSLLTLGRATRASVAVGVALAVFAVAVGGGWLVG